MVHWGTIDLLPCKGSPWLGSANRSALAGFPIRGAGLQSGATSTQHPHVGAGLRPAPTAPAATPLRTACTTPRDAQRPRPTRTAPAVHPRVELKLDGTLRANVLKHVGRRAHGATSGVVPLSINRQCGRRWEIQHYVSAREWNSLAQHGVPILVLVQSRFGPSIEGLCSQK